MTSNKDNFIQGRIPQKEPLPLAQDNIKIDGSTSVLSDTSKDSINIGQTSYLGFEEGTSDQTPRTQDHYIKMRMPDEGKIDPKMVPDYLFYSFLEKRNDLQTYDNLLFLTLGAFLDYVLNNLQDIKKLSTIHILITVVLLIAGIFFFVRKIHYQTKAKSVEENISNLFTETK